MATRQPRPVATIKQRRIWGHTLRVLGWLALSLGTASGAFAFQFLRSSRATGPLQGWPQAAVELALMALLLAGGRWSVRQGRRHLTPVLEAIPDSERIVLFLRAFSDDGGFAHVPSGHRHGPWAAEPDTEEEQIARAVTPFGRLVGLGRPSDSLPHVGAARQYASDDDWRAQVLTGLDRADLVLLACGPGRSLRWEVEQVVSRDEPERLVLVIARDVQQYSSFQATMADAFPQGLPDYEPVKPSHNVAEDAFTRAVVWFDADWTPHLEHLDTNSDISMLISMNRWVETAFPLAIRPVYERAGLAMPGLPAGPRTRPWPVWAAIAVLALTCAAAASLWLPSVHDFGSVVGVLAATVMLPALLLYLVWWGGFFSTMLARFIGLFFGGVFTVLILGFMVLDEPNKRLAIGLSLCAGVLIGGLLLRRKDVREWVASLILFR
jgi:hypothetical protein